MATLSIYTIKHITAVIALLSLLSTYTRSHAADKGVPVPTDVRAKGQKIEQATEFDASTILVQFKTNLSERDRKRVISSFDGSVIRSYSIIPGLAEVRVGTTIGDALSVLSSSKDVIAAEPNYRITVADVPNDPSFSKQWALDSTTAVHINAVRAWGLLKGSHSLRIAVLDTGIDKSHPEFVDNIWTNPNEVAGDGIDNDSNGYIDDTNGWDFTFTTPGTARDNGDNNPADGNGHGTHVSGIIAAQGNNALGISGICWDAALVPVKVIGDDGSGFTSWMISGLEYCVRNGISVANASIGGASYSTFCKAAIEAAGLQGNLLLVAAAGNNGTDNDVTPFYPASYDATNIISVASTTSTGALSSFSNRGLLSVDIAAPGSSILSTYPQAKVASGYTTLSGTSMATPMVTAVAALLSENRPEWGFSEIKTALLTSVTPLSGLSNKVASGGLLNAYQALVLSNRVDPVSLQLSRDVLRGGDSLTAELTIDRIAAVGGAVAEFASTNSAVRFPATVRIPEGLSSVTVMGSVVSVGTITTGNVTATISGKTLSVPVTVKPPMLAGVRVDMPRIAPGGIAHGFVSLQQPAGETGLDIRLSSPEPGITFPSFVHIDAGQTDTSFDLVVAATCPSGTYQVVAATDSDAVMTDVCVLAARLERIVFNPAVVVSRQTMSLQVTLTSPAPAGGLQLALSGDDARLPVPVLLNIPAGLAQVDVVLVAPTVTTRTQMSVNGTFYGTAASASVQVVPCTLSAVIPDVNDLACGASTPVTVRLNGVAGPGGFDVYLTDISRALSFPSIVHIVEGQSSAVAIVRALNVSTRVKLNLVASDGTTELIIPMVVSPVDIALLSLGATTVTGGASVSGTVTLAAPAPGSGADVYISSNQSAVIVPNVVHIPGGASTASIVLGSSAVRDKTIANIAASAGSIAKSKSLTINPAALSSVKVALATVTGGVTQVGTVLLSGPAPVGGLIVTLSSTNTALQIPATIVVPAGETTAIFPIESSPVAEKVTGLVGAQQGLVKKTTSVSVIPAVLSGISSSRSKIVGGETVSITIQLNGLAPPSGATIALTSGNVALAVPTMVTVPAGSSTVVVTGISQAVTKLVSVKVSGTAGLTTKTVYVSVSPK